MDIGKYFISILCMYNFIYGCKIINLYWFVVGFCLGNKYEYRLMCISVGMMFFLKYVNDGCILIWFILNYNLKRVFELKIVLIYLYLYEYFDSVCFKIYFFRRICCK